MKEPSPDNNETGHSYHGGALNGDLPGGRRSGSLTITEHTLRFTGDEIQRTLPLSGLVLKEGGAGNRLLFFSHNDLPHWSFFTSDRTILKDEFLNRSPHTASALKAVRHSKRRGMLVTATILLVLGGLVLGGAAGLYSLKEPMIRAVARQIPPEWEEKLGEMAFRQISLQNRFYEDPKLLRYLHAITDPVANEAKKRTSRPYRYRFHLAANDEVNAFALPGGHMVINSGLIEQASSAEEVAGVVAHEIAHVNEQHSLRQLIGTAGLYLTVQTLLGDMEGLLAILADNSAYLITLQFSRGYEEEADEVGWEYLTGAGIHPRGMVDFFDTLHKEEEKSGVSDTLPALLSTHPATEERMEILQKKWDSLPDRERYKRLPVNFRAFQKRLRTLAVQTELKE